MLLIPTAVNAASKAFGGKDVVKDPLTQFDKKFISGDWEAKRDQKAREQKAIDEQQAATDAALNQQRQGIQDFQTRETQRLDAANQSGNDYYNTNQNIYNDEKRDTSRYESEYRNSLSNAENVSHSNMNDARETYKTLAPMQREAMDDAREQTKSAMTLADYMNPNNAVASGTRDLYNTEGQTQRGIYEQEAMSARGRGLADYGVLASLGAQAAQGQSQGPMTVGQQMANMSTANQQASEAYAATQRRMQALRDMGLQSETSLRTQGLGAGERMSDKAYEAGRMSKEDLSRRMQEFEGLSDRNINRTSGISDRLVGLSGQELASNQRQMGQQYGGLRDLGNLRYGLDQSDISRRSGLDRTTLQDMTALSDKRIGSNESDLSRIVAMINSERGQAQKELAGRQGVLTGAINAGGTVAGGAFGGPAGAAAGGAAAGAATGAMMPPQQPVNAPTVSPYTAGNYNYAPQPAFNPYQPDYNRGYPGGANYPARPTTNPYGGYQ